MTVFGNNRVGLERASSFAVLLAGASALLAAALWSDARIERWFIGSPTGALSWGPRLFRILLGFHGAVAVAAAGFGFLRSGSAGARGTVPEWRRALAAVEGPAGRDALATEVAPSALYAAGALVVLALVLRLYKLGTGLWLDEILTLTSFARLPWTEIVTSFPDQNQHMLYSLLAHGSVSVLGESPAAVRLPAALMGAASIWALFRFGGRVSGWREGLMAAALVTVSYHHVWFSQNARGYTGLLLFSLLATDAWVVATAHGGLRRWAKYAVWSALGVWVHMTMVFVVGSHALISCAELSTGLFRRRTESGSLACRRWQPIAGMLLAGTASLQLYALALPDFMRSALHEAAAASAEWLDPGWVVRETIARLGDAGLAGGLLAAASLVALAGWLSMLRKDWRVGLALVLPAVLGGTTMLALKHPLWPRFFFFCAGFFVLIAVRGVVWLSDRCGALCQAMLRLPVAVSSQSVSRALSTTAIVAMACLSAATLPRAYRPKQDFESARDYVERHRKSGEAVAAVGLAAKAYRRYYAPEWPELERAGDIGSLAHGAMALWLVYTLPVQLESEQPDVWRLITEKCSVVARFDGTLGGGAVNVCRLRLGAE